MPDIFVKNTTQLNAALVNAQGGETILLAPGEYGDVALRGSGKYDFDYPDTVTIASADPSNPAVFSQLDVRNAGNITFDGIRFDYDFTAGDKIFFRPFSVSGSSDISIINSTFDGDKADRVSSADDGYGYAIGLSIRSSQNITIEGNEFFDFHRAVTVSESSDVRILENDIHSIRMDGLNFAQVTDVQIVGNYIHDFNGSPNSGDHSDMIQFWTNGTTAPSSGIVIRDNHLDIGNGTATQSIFMRNDQVDLGLAGEEMYYRDILIENNTIVNGHLHGIVVGATRGLSILQNTVVHADGRQVDGADGAVEIPRISVADLSENVEISGNITSNIQTFDTPSSWVIERNVIVQDQDPLASGYYANVFVASSLMSSSDGLHAASSANTMHQFFALPGSLIDITGAGANGVRPSHLDQTGHFSVTPDPYRADLYHFSSLIDASSLPHGTTFTWYFGDGTSATGASTTHNYPSGGFYESHLVITSPGAPAQSQSATIKVEGNNILSFDGVQGFVAHDAGTTIYLDPSVYQSEAGLALQAHGVSATVPRSHVADILGSNQFDVSFSLSATSGTSNGEVFRLHGSTLVQVKSDGGLVVTVWTTEGERLKLSSIDIDLADQNQHDIGLRYSDDILELWIDGNLNGQIEMVDPLASTGRHDLTFGHAWGGQNFESIISEFDIALDGELHLAQDYPPSQTHLPTETPAVDSHDNDLVFAQICCADSLF